VLYTVWCLPKSYAHKNICKKNLWKKEKEKQQHREGLMLGIAYLMPDRWLEDSLHPEGSATGQLDQGFL
jgi:hypothetical protein